MSSDLVFVPSIVPIFPLPEVVLFPRTVVPLHIFEARYREMMADAIKGQRFIALAMLVPGHEELYRTDEAPIYPVVGVGHIDVYEMADDGTYNLFLRGITRAKVESEVGGRPYRRGRIQRIETFSSTTGMELEQWRAELRQMLEKDTSLDERVREVWLATLDADLDANDLADSFAGGLPASAELRQRLLEEPDAMERLQIIMTHLQAMERRARNLRRVRPGGVVDLN